jgi:Ser/Thr protein kinase RdoA (MazF antagonist)
MGCGETTKITNVAFEDYKLLKDALSLDEKTSREVAPLLGPGYTLSKSSNGVSNEVFFARTESGTKAVIKICTKDSMQRVEQICSVTAALNEKGVATPKVLGLHQNSRQQPVLVMEFVHGSHTELTPERLHDIGQAMGRLHTVEIGSPDLPKKEFTKAFFEELFTLCPDWDRLPEIREAYKQIDMSYLNKLPRSLVHGDFSKTNVITNGKGPYLIDFDHVHYDYSLTDLARAQLFFGFIETSLDEETIRHMCRGYDRVRPLTEVEKQCFYRHLKLIIIWGLLDEYYHIYKVKDLSGPRFEANEFNRCTSIPYLLEKLRALKDKEFIQL